MIGMITIFSMYIAHVHLGSGRNSYQGHVHDSQEFSRVLGCPCVRCHWKCNIVDTFTHHFCANRHGWTIGTSFPYIRKSERWYSSPVQYIAFPLILVGSTLLYKLYYQLKPFTRWQTGLLCYSLCCTTVWPSQESLKTFIFAHISVVDTWSLVASHVMIKITYQELRWATPPLHLFFRYCIRIRKWQKPCNIDMCIYKRVCKSWNQAHLLLNIVTSQILLITLITISTCNYFKMRQILQ